MPNLGLVILVIRQVIQQVIDMSSSKHLANHLAFVTTLFFFQRMHTTQPSWLSSIVSTKNMNVQECINTKMAMCYNYWKISLQNLMWLSDFDVFDMDWKQRFSSLKWCKKHQNWLNWCKSAMDLNWYIKIKLYYYIITITTIHVSVAAMVASIQEYYGKGNMILNLVNQIALSFLCKDDIVVQGYNI